MNREDSILGIFQDPLLTLIALILLGTLPVIMPMAGSDRPEAALDGRPLHEIQVRVEELREEIRALDRQMDALKEDLRRLGEEIQALRERKVQREKGLLDLEHRVARLLAEIAAIREIITQKEKELKDLESELAAAKTRAQEAERIQELEQEIRRVQKELAQKRAFIEGLERELDKQNKIRETIRQAKQAQKGQIAALESEVRIEKDQVAALEAEKREIEKSLSRMGGMGQYTQEAVGDRKGTGFEASDNRLFSVDDHNYKSEILGRVNKGIVIGIKKFTKKDDATGESPDAILREESRFQSKLKELDPKKNYLVFLVQQDAYPVFLKARKLAWDKGFVVGWRPFNGGPIYAGPGQGEGR
jgi:chromosome segregation ATPase